MGRWLCKRTNTGRFSPVPRFVPYQSSWGSDDEISPPSHDRGELAALIKDHRSTDYTCRVHGFQTAPGSKRSNGVPHGSVVVPVVVPPKRYSGPLIRPRHSRFRICQGLQGCGKRITNSKRCKQQRYPLLVACQNRTRMGLSSFCAW